MTDLLKLILGVLASLSGQRYLCLSEFKLARTDDEVRREMAQAKCDQRHVLFAATARPC
jgi:hypothetical protein